MDDHERKRRMYIATILVDAIALIHVMLRNLDGIRLAFHDGDDARERFADDLMTVYANILPNVEAPDEQLSVVRTILADWVNLDSLAVLAAARDLSPARGQAMEELADRLSMMISAARDAWPGMFGLDE